MSKSFSDLLAAWQAGRNLRPGKTLIAEDVPEEVITKVWGSVPSATTMAGVTFLFQQTGPQRYRVIVRFT